MKNDITIIITHSGGFHTDDVFAVASLQLLLGDTPSKVIRTREEEMFTSGDYVVDVGGKYDPEKNRFDHHQQEDAGKRDNGIPYASFGLVWKKYGKEICSSKEVAERIDEKLVQLIDAGDNGVDISNLLFKDVLPYTISNVVDLFAPTWKEENNFDEQFLSAVSWAKEILEREIKKTTDKIEAKNKVKEVYERAEDKRLIVLDSENETYGRTVRDTLVEYPEPLYAVFYGRASKQWNVTAIRKDKTTV